MTLTVNADYSAVLPTESRARPFFEGGLAVASLVATALPAWVAACTGVATILLTIAFNPLLLIDFTRAVAFTCAFHRRFSFFRDSQTRPVLFVPLL